MSSETVSPPPSAIANNDKALYCYTEAVERKQHKITVKEVSAQIHPLSLLDHLLLCRPFAWAISACNTERRSNKREVRKVMW